MPNRSRHHRSSRRFRRKRAQRIVVIALASLVGVLVLSAVWVTVRGLMAREQLEGAIPTAMSIRDSVLTGDVASLDDQIRVVQTRATQAESLTSDPVWRAVEVLPLFGDNLRVIRQGAAVAAEIATSALPPISGLAATVTAADLTPQGGAFNLTTLASIAPDVADARAAVDRAAEQAAVIDTSTALPPIGNAVDELVDLVSQTKIVVDGMDAAVTLLPAMLGGDGPRRYLLMSLNSAELRSSGGIPGALSVITADGGALSIGESTSASGLGRFDPPVIEQTPAELALFKGLTGTFMQDVNLTPNFSRAAETARAMWQTRIGTPIDGVVSVDPVALGYILAATGPIDAGSGIVLDSTNASKVLLSDSYQLFPDPAAQDAFYADVTSRVFRTVTAGSINSPALLAALGTAIVENRIHLWSTVESEQTVIEQFPVAGTLPTSSETTAGFGVYLNDRTESKMDYYLTGEGVVGAAQCRADGRPIYRVDVTLGSTVTDSIASTLSDYVVGAGVPGRPRGVIATNLFVYAPAEAIAFSVRVNGIEQGFTSAVDSDRVVAGIDVILDPGATARVEMLFLGGEGAPLDATALATPTASGFPVEFGGGFACPDPSNEGTQIDARMNVQPDETTVLHHGELGVLSSPWGQLDVSASALASPGISTNSPGGGL